jgi:acyl-coenzyme A thioesterase PaaI-like protein
MTRTLPAPGRLLRDAWRRLAPLPGGRFLFSLMLGRMVPYTGALGARVEALEPGYARLTLRDRRGVRNHLGSVHAVALANLAEVTSGLAMLTGLPENARGIVVHIGVEYLKKARGTLTAECRCRAPSGIEETVTVTAGVMNASGEVVARAEVRWLIRPVEAPSHA